jgi:hypothetical protein
MIWAKQGNFICWETNFCTLKCDANILKTKTQEYVLLCINKLIKIIDKKLGY